MDRYGVDADGRWRDEPSFRRLSDEEKGRVQVELGEALVLLASPGEGEPVGASPRSNADDALRLNRLAETCYPDGQAPRALWAQRAELEARLGHDEESAASAREGRRGAGARPLGRVSPAREEACQGRLGQAADELRAVAVREPDNFAVQFLMGNCCLDGYIDGLGQDSDAVGCYSACIAMRPDFHAAYANRGLMRLRRGLFEEAEADFTRAVQLRPDRADYLLHRAEAREGLHHNQEELDDLNQAEELGSKAVLLYYLRAALQQRMGHDLSARRNLSQVLKLTPDDETGFTARGLARASDGDLEGALADFTEAVKRNPNSCRAYRIRRRSWRRVWANREALAPLDRLVALYPTFAAAYGAGGGAGAAGDAQRGLGGYQTGAATRPERRRGALPGRLGLRPIGASGRRIARRRSDVVPGTAKGLRLDRHGARRRPDVVRKDPRYADLARTAELLQMGGR